MYTLIALLPALFSLAALVSWRLFYFVPRELDWSYQATVLAMREETQADMNKTLRGW